MRPLSKSRLLAFRQCQKRLWLDIHCPELRKDSSSTQASFSTGHQVGAMARQLYAPLGQGTVIDGQAQGIDAALASSQALLQAGRPIFEAGFRSEGALAFADVLLPIKRTGGMGWRMVEVKSATSVKDYHRDDVAIQAHVSRAAGLALDTIALAHIDSSWTYAGHGDYRGLLVEADLTQEAFSRDAQVRHWIADAQDVAARPQAPDMTTGPHCHTPHECGFHAHCQSQEPQASHPIRWLPGRHSRALAQHIQQHGARDLRDIPDEHLSETQLRVKTATLSGQTYFDRQGAASALAGHTLPIWFLDFETVQFAVPVWGGTRPYQQIPFQFSIHRLSRSCTLSQDSFLDLSGHDPSFPFAEALIAACGSHGPIFVYNASFEKSRIRELAQRFPRLAPALLALNERIVDLHPVAHKHYYHPNQHGSWSIKHLLPAICPDLRYSALDGVQDGAMAMTAFLEAIAPASPPARKAEIQHQLLAYCALDTYAMVRLWSTLSGRDISP